VRRWVESRGGDLVTGDLAVGKLFTGQRRPCFGLTDGWDRADYRARLAATRCALDRVHLAANWVLILFLLFFFRFECKLQKFTTWARNVQMEWTKFC
jgi:hypothetical protein